MASALRTPLYYIVGLGHLIIHLDSLPTLYLPNTLQVSHVMWLGEKERSNRYMTRHQRKKLSCVSLSTYYVRTVVSNRPMLKIYHGLIN